VIDGILSNRLQIWGFEDGVTVFKDFSLGAIFKISTLDISAQTDEAINNLKESLRQFLNGLPPGLSLQFMQEIVPGNIETIRQHRSTLLPDVSDLVRNIVDERIENFTDLDKAGLLPKQTLYLLVRKPFDKMPEKMGWFSVFSNKRKDLSERSLRSEIQIFERALENIDFALSSLEISAERISEQEVFKLIYEQWNPGRKIEAPEMSTIDVRDQLIMTDAVLGLDHFLLGRTYHKVISLKLLPEQTFASMAEKLKDLPFKSKLLLSIEVQDQNKEISALQMQRRMAYASVVGKKGVSDLEAQAKLQDIEAILEEMIQGAEKVFRFSLTVVLQSEDENDLEDQVANVLQLFRELSGAEGMLETVAGFDVFTESSLPNARAKIRSLKVNTSVLADFLPVFGNWKGHKEPKVLLRNRDGELLPFDPFSSELTNFNMIVSGGSGAGKSFFTNSLLSQMLKESPKIFILDIGASYRRTCENLGGQYVELGLKSSIAINPFSLDGLSAENSESFDQKIKFLVSLVEMITKESADSNLGKLEKAEIEKAIKDVLKNESEAQLSHLMKRLLHHPEKEIQRIGRILGLWCGDSPFGKLIDRPTSISLEKDLVCFDLKGLESHPELQAAFLFIITDLIWRETQRDRTQMKFAVFDECWRLLQDEAACLFIGSVFRTFRKYKASAIAISQTIDDFAQSKIAAAVMPNSSIKWVLKQKGADQNNLKMALQLNDREMGLISSLTSEKGKYSEAFLMAEDKRQVVRVETTPLEYWLFTTEPSDIALLEKTKLSHLHLSDVEILRKLARSYPEGALNVRSEEAA
jgi:conjugal transfer ATP-binding protein TraC